MKLSASVKYAANIIRSISEGPNTLVITDEGEVRGVVS